MASGFRAERLDLSEIFFSNEEYYSKLEELKRAHLRTMAELESMYRRKLQLRSAERLDVAALETRHRWGGVPAVGCFKTEPAQPEETTVLLPPAPMAGLNVCK